MTEQKEIENNAIGFWQLVEFDPTETSEVNQPSQRSLHSSAMFQDKLYVFGGNERS